MSDDLRAALQDMSQFISLDVGENFIGVYRGFKRIPNNFDPEKETIELSFDIGGSIKTLTSMSLPQKLVEANVSVGEQVIVTKAAKKGNSITWLVQKGAKQTVAEQVQEPVKEATPSDNPLL